MDLSYISAPMINQSDLPFRLLVRQYGTTLTYTQMLHPERLLEDKDYLDFHLRDLEIASRLGEGRPVVVQVCGNDPEVVVRGARKVVGLCDAIDLNLGCPQDHAREGHYGGYLLNPSDWPLVTNIVSSLNNSLPIPISTKIRVCTPPHLTLQLAHKLEGAGSKWITLHARSVCARRRRKGAANLDEVRKLMGGVGIPVVSNGNVRCWEDVQKNKEETGAGGIMVGETLLGNPCLFAGVTPDPAQISLEYLSLCAEYPDTVRLEKIKTHIRHFVEFQWYVVQPARLRLAAISLLHSYLAQWLILSSLLTVLENPGIPPSASLSMLANRSRRVRS
ncbi:hypothetical protein JAAARDRAFT_176349 [Jaapia argillacea MUCL 33604]|uniref:tRNA-dihydrouridine(16/17) synthase [NAD(P)(+)] n=1 Tax=Jaapia argillacea MUCL 33604 TaxID=933084 RepID=A0A067Q4M5_9AGAM|nr:hypothetical protein JAAARDRAFT_176349 [Jaapia argillacea MUCL 33604]